MKKQLVFILLVLPVFFYGTILHVPDEYATIQSAINVSAGGDTILVAPGIYFENLEIESRTVILASEFIITNDTTFISQTIIDGGGIGTVIYMFNCGPSNRIIGLTIRNGFTSFNGGGICLENASPKIQNCVITDNVSTTSNGGGGGIACFVWSSGTTSPHISDCTIKNNLASDGAGGGLFCDFDSYGFGSTSVILNNVVFRNNTARRYGGGFACWENSYAYLTDVKFIGNSVIWFHGGGMLIGYFSNCDFENVVFEQNSCPGLGGGLNCYQSSTSMVNVIFRQNNAKMGAGMYLESIYKSINFNVLFEENFAENNGGALYCKRAAPFLKNITFTENRADKGTAIFCKDASNPLLISNILYGNQPQQIVFADTGTANAVRINYSNIQGGIHFVETNDNGTIEWGEGNLNRNPMFVSEGEHPYQISDNSWCIDAGDPDTTGQTYMLDLAGEPRLVNDRVDMGAYEWNLMVNTPIEEEIKVVNTIVFPNPFTTTTTISYDLPQPSTVHITIFNHLGKKVDFIQQNQPQGKQQITWNASGQPSGVYYFRMQAGEEVATGKLLLVR